MLKKKTIVESFIHPDTGKPIFWPMRMSSLVPINLPIVFGIIMTRQTPLNTAFWQWLNQTYNAGMNYGNRNASSPNTINDLIVGYSLAVTSSIGVSLGLKKLSYNLTKNLHGGTAILAHSVISYLAVATASFLNSYCMRRGEMKKGIKIYDELGEEMGISKISAKKAVLQTASSRIVLSFPIFMIPGIGMAALDRLGMIPRSRALRIAVELSLIGFSLWIALPLSVALFPQKGEISSNQLE